MTQHADHDHEHGLPPKSSVKRWLVTTNHKDIGVLYTVTAIFFLVAGGILAMLIRSQLWTPGGTVLGGQGYNQAVTSHGLLMVFWFISPFAFGLANYLVPLQIGADDLAFPRLNALSYWLYLASGLLFLSSFFLGSSLAGGWTIYQPLNVPAYIPEVNQVGSLATIFALMMFVAAVTMGSVNFLTTFYRMRAEGLRIRDMPMFSVSILLTVWMMLFAFAALLAAVILLSFDHLLGSVWFSTAEGGSLLWAHLFWFFGHPEVYIVFFPALGVMAEVFQTFSGKRIVGRKWFVIAMALVAIQSFVVWMHHMFLTAINLPIKTIFMATTIGISLPFDLMVFALIYTLVKGKVRFKTPFLFAFGALLLFILGGITGVFLGAVVLDYQFRGTYWVVAHFHYVMFGGGTALIGGLYYWFPKMTGRMYDEFLGKVHFALFFVGFNLLYFPMFVVWETPRRVFDYAAEFTMWHRVATVGAIVFAGSFLVMMYNLFKSLHSGEEAPDNPWEYGSAGEWAVPSPPPLENYPGVPSYAGGKLSFLSRTEAADGGTVVEEQVAGTAEKTAADGGAIAHAGATATTPTTGYAEDLALEEEHADHASIWPMAISAGAFVTFLGLSGISKAYFIWPFVFGVGFMVAYFAFEGARREGLTWVHPVVMALGGAIAAGGAYVLALDKGGFGAAIDGASPYFWVTTVGALVGGVSLTQLGMESFHVPEPTIAEQWPYEKVKNVKLGMWMFLGSDVILFGAFIGGYIFMRVGHGWTHWHHDLIPEAHVVLPGLINTYFLLASSFTVVLALVAARNHNRRRLLAYLWTTFFLGVGFLVNKAIEWQHLFHLHEGAYEGGWTFATNIASSTFYITTGLHGAHVAVGLLITLYLIVRASNGAYLGEEGSETVEYFGLYWHFVDIVWLFLFPLFYIL
ncbi:cytochrome C oxidase subunit I [Halobacteriales archaeon SW_10_68_16]|nr:MAG: cytochrome C oxidase subunit I [Halobacteriales archaeon SW_10_68_16]